MFSWSRVVTKGHTQTQTQTQTQTDIDREASTKNFATFRCECPQNA
jgi:hypothetical protein